MLHGIGPLVAGLALLIVLPAGGQTCDRLDALARVDSLSAIGQYGAAATLLEPLVRRSPGEAEDWLLLGQYRYWAQDIEGARTTYEQALDHHPSNQRLRVAYARFLAENRDTRDAVSVLQPLGADVADAEALRGTLAWWRGDLSSAVRHFKRAAATDAESASALATIRAGARPWLRIGGEGGLDNQPMRQGGARTEVGVYVTPLQAMSAEVVRSAFAAGDSLTPMTFTSVSSRGFWPFARLETELTAGIVHRPGHSTWTGRAGAGWRLPHGIRVDSHWERAPYLYTVASISESVFTTSVQLRLSADHNGWLGEAVGRRERFPDRNTKEVAYAWLMAPLLRSVRATLQAGYAYGYQDAAEHRFAPVLAAAPRPGRPPEWEGRYVPYYTPLDQHVHSVTGHVSVRPVPGLTVRANGAFGFAGREDSPFVYVSGRVPVTGVYRHAIRPWNARFAVTAAVTSGLSVQIELSHLSTTWYDASDASLSLYTRL
jgi:tetratricopeptide (TPR) repeat protein